MVPDTLHRGAFVLMRRRATNLRTRSASGLTLVELMLSLTITAIVGVAISSMLVATSRATATSSDGRSLLVRHRIISARMNASVRQSTMVLETGSTYVVLWRGDSDSSGAPNMTELQRIELSSGSIISYRWSLPAGWSDVAKAAADTAYNLNSNFNTATNTLKSSAYCTTEVWTTGVTAWSLTLDSATAQNASLLSYRVTIQLPGYSTTDTVIGAAALHTPSMIQGGT